jgi:hypothetical protein
VARAHRVVVAMGQAAFACFPGGDARLVGTQQGGKLALGKPQGLAEGFKVGGHGYCPYQSRCYECAEVICAHRLG